MDRNTRHSVDKGQDFIKSGMTLITDVESDRHLEYFRAKMQMESPYNDGWTKQFYKDQVEKYEKENQKEDN